MKPGRGFASPLVEVEVVGMPCDVAKNKTHQVGKEERGGREDSFCVFKWRLSLYFPFFRL